MFSELYEVFVILLPFPEKVWKNESGDRDVVTFGGIMVELLFIFITAIAVIFTAYVSALVGTALGGLLSFLQLMPEWMPTVVLAASIVLTLRRFRYSP